MVSNITVCGCADFYEVIRLPNFKCPLVVKSPVDLHTKLFSGAKQLLIFRELIQSSFAATKLDGFLSILTSGVLENRCVMFKTRY
jgi:hypothetical protein